MCPSYNYTCCFPFAPDVIRKGIFVVGSCNERE